MEEVIKELCTLIYTGQVVEGFGHTLALPCRQVEGWSLLCPHYWGIGAKREKQFAQRACKPTEYQTCILKTKCFNLMI